MTITEIPAPAKPKAPKGPKAADFYTVGQEVRDAKAPGGPIDKKWSQRKFEAKLVNPSNRRKLTVIIVGTGLAGGAAAASLGEAGYNVLNFCYQDSPRRAHSIAAQGGINAAKNYRNDNDSTYRLFYDTVKGGDYRSRETNVYRLAEVSANIIDQCVAQGVPFAREYGGLLDTRSFGGVQVQRTFYARGQTGQQLLIGAYQALERQIAAGTVKMYNRHEMLELILVDGKARGIITRNMVTGEIDSWFADAVVLATGGYGNVFFLSTNAMGCNVTADWRAHRKGAYFGNLVPRDIASRQAKYRCDEGRGVGPAVTEFDSEGNEVKVRRGVYLDFADAISRLGKDGVAARYGNLFDMYAQITGENPYETPMRIYPAVHYTMGGLWVDYDLSSNIPGLYVTGEANFSDHGANRLGASALMQGLADGYFVLPNTINDYLAAAPFEKIDETHPAAVEALESVKGRIDKLLSVKGSRTVDSFHKELGHIMWEYCGMERTEAGLMKAIGLIRELRDEFWRDVKVTGVNEDLNQTLERAGRVADFFELGELMCIDALHRRESCGGHFRAESQTPDGEALRDDENFLYVAAWEYAGDKPVLHKEPLEYEYIELKQRSYK